MGAAEMDTDWIHPWVGLVFTFGRFGLLYGLDVCVLINRNIQSLEMSADCCSLFLYLLPATANKDKYNIMSNVPYYGIHTHIR